MTATEIVLSLLVALAVVEAGFIFLALVKATRELRALHRSIDAAADPPGRWPPYPAEWRVDEKAGPLMLCQFHLEVHDQEQGVSFTPLEPARAGSQCAACLREATIQKARMA